MKKYLTYEVKKNLWTMVILTAVCTILYLPEVLSLKMVFLDKNEETGEVIRYIESSGIESIFIYLMLLCFVVPVLTYSFKMNKRSVDAYYSLPLKKEKLYLCKVLSGLMLIIVPFTIAYWAGFLALLCKSGNPYHMLWYVPAYFGGIVLAILLFGINSFLFTRANTVADGVVFMIGFAFIGNLVTGYLDACFGYNLFAGWWIGESFSTGGAFTVFGAGMGELIKGNTAQWSVWSFAYITVIGILGYVFLFFCLKQEKAENAEQISDNVIGYRILIPAYAAFMLGMGMGALIEYAMIIVAEIVATIVYQRKFRFKKKEWWRILAGVVIGTVLCFIAGIG